MDYTAARSLLLRFLLYAALLAGTFQWLVIAIDRHGARWAVRDDGPVEITQLLAALFTAVLFWMLSKERERFAELFRLFAALALIACARELDNFTLELGSRHAYLLIAAVPLGWALWGIHTARGRLIEQVGQFSRTAGFPLLMAGFLIVVVYAQIIGQKELWLAILEPEVYRPVKDVVEEASELLGYLLMLFGAAEAAAADPHLDDD